MKKFLHVLITRFNLRDPDWKKDKHSIGVLDEAWMSHRWRLFDTFCFPSVTNQSCKDFKWLILFGHEARDIDKEKIRSRAAALENIEIVSTAFENTRSDMLKHVGNDVEFLISTRLDNDDALHEDAVAAIQRKFSEQDFEFLNLQKGYKYVAQNKRLVLSQNMSGPFMTLIEKKNGPFKTVHCEEHQKIRGRWPLQQIADKRYWIQLIHSRNLENAHNGRRMSAANIFSLFNNERSVMKKFHISGFKDIEAS